MTYDHAWQFWQRALIKRRHKDDSNLSEEQIKSHFVEPFPDNYWPYHDQNNWPWMTNDHVGNGFSHHRMKHKNSLVFGTFPWQWFSMIWPCNNHWSPLTMSGNDHAWQWVTMVTWKFWNEVKKIPLSESLENLINVFCCFNFLVNINFTKLHYSSKNRKWKNCKTVLI